MQSPILETASGLSLVPAVAGHAPLLAELVRRDHAYLNAFLPLVATLSTLDAARAHLERPADDAVRDWHLFDGERLCGSIRLKDIDGADRKAGIGYFLGSEFAGRGIVTAAVRAVLAWAFGPLGLNRIELRCAVHNERSMRVAERLGFVREGLLRQDECLNGVFVDHHIYSLLKAEFRR